MNFKTFLNRGLPRPFLWQPYLALPMLTLGCASVNPSGDYERVDREVRQMTGQELSIRPGQEAAARSAVDELLAAGLTAESSARLALLNNPRVLAELLRAGMARADVVQAGLFSNPSVGIAFKLPEGGGLAMFQASLAQNIADLWMIPARTRAAERDLDRVILEAAREATATAQDARQAYYAAVAADRSHEISVQNVELVRQLQSITQARFEAGAVGSLDVNLARGLLLRAQVDQQSARLAASTARRVLATVLGVDRSIEDVRLIEPLVVPADGGIDAATLIQLARASRADLRAADETVRAAESRLELEKARVFQSVEIGLDLERDARRAMPGRTLAADAARASIAGGGPTVPEIESRGQRRASRAQEIESVLGPSLRLTVPVFDQNQAQIEKARLALEEARALRDALYRTVVQEAHEAADRLRTASDILRLFDREVIPQAQVTLELSNAAYQAGQTPMLNVIDAQRSLLDTRKSYVAALQSAMTAVVDLERATARPANAWGQPATRAVTEAPTPSANGSPGGTTVIRTIQPENAP